MWFISTLQSTARDYRVVSLEASHGPGEWLSSDVSPVNNSDSIYLSIYLYILSQPRKEDILTGLSECYAPVICNHGPYGAREQRWYWYIFAKPAHMPSTAGTFLRSKPCKKACSNPGMQMWYYLVCLGMRIKSPMSVVPRHYGDDAEVKTWHLTPAMSPAPIGRGYKRKVHNAHHFKHSPMGPGFWSVFAVCSKGSQGPKLSSCGHRRLWSDWADAQADPSLRWAHVVGFVVHGGLPHPLPFPMSTNAKHQRRIFLVFIQADFDINRINPSCILKKQIHCLPWK